MRRVLLVSFISFFCFAISIFAVIWYKTTNQYSNLHQKIKPLRPISRNKVTSQELFVVKLNGKYGCINRNGQLIVEAKFDDIRCSSEELLPIEINNKWGYANQAGEVVLEPQFDFAHDFNEGLAVVLVNKKWGYINLSGNYAIEPQFDYGDTFYEGFATIGKDDLSLFSNSRKFCFIDKEGKMVIEAKFDRAERFFEGLANVSINGKTDFIDKSGQFSNDLQGNNFGGVF